MKLRCINDFRNMRDAELVNKALSVHSGMASNTVFVNPPVLMPALALTTQQYSDALVNAESRDKVKVSLKNKLRKALVDQLAQLLAFVNVKSNGDKPTLLSSGFTLCRETGTTYELDDFGEVTVSYGKNSGEVLVRYGKVAGAVSYLVDFTESPVQDDHWKSEPETYLKHLLGGLIRGKEYAIRVRAVGRGGETTTSKPTTILVV